MISTFPLRELAGSPTLTESVVGQLRSFIQDARLAPGDQLPTEKRLTEALNISRSVLREAVATLRAEGLLVSRRGAGVFVAEQSSRLFRISETDLGAVANTVKALELRTGVEVEAAGLAARRRKASDIETIAGALHAMVDERVGSEKSAAADFQFHVAIANAADNNFFPEFLSYLGNLLIPRQRLRLQADPATGMSAYGAMLAREHQDILDAITVRDELGAREAMRRHLAGAVERYRRWSAEDSE